MTPRPLARLPPTPEMLRLRTVMGGLLLRRGRHPSAQDHSPQNGVLGAGSHAGERRRYPIVALR